MKIRTSLLAIGLIATVSFAQESKEDAIKIGNEAFKTMLQKMGGGLKSHLKKGGPIAAAEYCSINAQSMTAEINKGLKDGVTIKRVSLNPRNQINTPTKDEKIILESLENLKAQGVILPPYFLEEMPNGDYKYYKPIVIDKPVCLKCHGNISGNKVGNWMKEHYPQDKAINHKMGDIRGVAVVEIKN